MTAATRIASTGPAAPPQAEALKAAVRALPAERFAVMDGALFDDLAEDLKRHGLIARPLFLEAGDPQTVAAGPFLLPLREPADGERLFAFYGARRLPVFWSWPSGETALFRHLRTLNMAEIPAEGRLSDDLPAYEAVIFRHWDPIVLNQILPLLSLPQVARFLGPSTGIAFHTGEPQGLMVGGRPISLPQPETRMLRFSAEQIHQLGAALREALVRRALAAFPALAGETAPQHRDRLEGSLRRGEQYGLQDADSIWHFLEIDLQLAPGFEHDPDHADVLVEMVAPDLSPAQRVRVARSIALHNATRPGAH